MELISLAQSGKELGREEYQVAVENGILPPTMRGLAGPSSSGGGGADSNPFGPGARAPWGV
jgi:hypothetical protein